jgi:PAN domain-containing protein
MHQFRAFLATCVVAISIAFVNPERAMALQSMFVFVQQADSPGNDYSRIDHSSFEKCELSCERDVACNAFTYNQIKGECFLKRAPAQWTTIRLGAITGIKLSPVQLPSQGE